MLEKIININDNRSVILTHNNLPPSPSRCRIHTYEAARIDVLRFELSFSLPLTPLHLRAAAKCTAYLTYGRNRESMSDVTITSLNTHSLKNFLVPSRYKP